MAITSINELRALGTVQEVEIPGWHDDAITVRLGRPSMMLMMKAGRIPNSLMETAQKLFNGQGAQIASGEQYSEMLDVIMTMVDATLVEPSLHDLREAGVELTDEQILAIFNYSQQGIRALENFRNRQANASAAGNDEVTKPTPQHASRHS